MTLRLFTLVHGEPYLSWMQRALVPSLSWPENRSALRWAEWHIYTTEDSQNRAMEIAARLEMRTHIKLIKPEWRDQTLANVVNELMIDAAQTGDQILMAPPDTIFGEGSLAAFLTMAKHPRLVISAAHVRVNTSFLDEFTGNVTSNAKLVGMAWRHLHKTWSDANSDLKFTNTFAGGVAWHKIAANLYAVTHLLPTPYYIDPHPSDAEWFRFYGHPGSIDHRWPGKLVDEGRQRLIGSSDAAFAVEITPPDKNIPVVYPKDPNDPTCTLTNQKHNHVNRNTTVVFRAE